MIDPPGWMSADAVVVGGSVTLLIPPVRTFDGELATLDVVAAFATFEPAEVVRGVLVVDPNDFVVNVVVVDSLPPTEPSVEGPVVVVSLS